MGEPDVKCRTASSNGLRIKCDLCHGIVLWEESYNHLGVRICPRCAERHVGDIAKGQCKKSTVGLGKGKEIDEFFGGL